MKKGQISITDLIMSVSIFIVLAAFIIYYWSATTARFDNDINYEELQLKTTRIADQLSKTPGDPSKWEVVWKNDLPHVYSMGLASSDRVLSDKKIFNLSEMASTQAGYDNIKRLLNIEGYDFNITVKIKDDILTLLRKFDIRVAYIQIGSKSFQASLETQLQSLFNCKDASSITNRKLERCEEYTSAAQINNPDGGCPPGCAFADNFNIFENLSEYDLLLMEDPRLFKPTGQGEPTFYHSNNITDYIQKGGFAFFTIAMSTNSSINTLGVTWTDGPTGGNNPRLILQPEYYNARDNGDEKFLSFAGSATNPIRLETNKPRAYITPRINANDFLIITNSSFEDVITGARWDFDKGRIYYFSDGRDVTISDEVGVASRRIVLGLASSLYSTLINSGKVPPKDANVVTVQRDVVFQNKSAVLEFTLWKQK